jgi:two-component system response regulator NreC
MGPIRIGIVEDHALVREGLRMILEAQPDLEVVGDASDPEGAFAIAALHRPHIMLVDLTLNGSDGITFVRDLAARHPRIRVIALTMHHDEETVRQAFLAGVAGYVVKGADSKELIAALRAVANNQHYVHPVVASVVIVDSLRWLRQSDRLSPREIEVLRLVTSGRTAVEAGRDLGISAHTRTATSGYHLPRCRTLRQAIQTSPALDRVGLGRRGGSRPVSACWC